MRARPRALLRFGTLGLVVAWLTVVIAGIAPRVLAADTVTAVSSDHAGAVALARAMVQDPETLTDASFVAVPPAGTPNGTSTGLLSFPTDGSTFGILTTGDATLADDPNDDDSHRHV